MTMINTIFDLANHLGVGGYCEGVDGQPEPHWMKYPFTGCEFDVIVAAADSDGCDLWNNTHGCDDCGWDGAINPDCLSCKGEGVVL